MSEATERIWRGFSVANERNPAQLHRWRLVLREIRRLNIAANETIVDLGCGSGALLLRVADRFPGAMLAGIDAEPLALEKARRTLPGAQFFAADLNRGVAIAELEGRAGVVTCSEVLEHLAEPRRALELARRLLRPGGHAIVTVPSGPMNAFDRSIGHLRHYSVSSLAELLRSAGFDARCYRWGFPFHTLYRVGIGLLPGSVDQFNDESMTAPKRAAFSALDVLFRMNVRGAGRQLVAVASVA